MRQLVILAILIFTAASASAAEIFVLKSGGKVRGTWLNRHESPRETFDIRTLAGGVISFDRGQVEQVVVLSPDELLYERMRPTFPDTVAGHEELAEWCLEKELHAQRRSHLERIVELDPNHDEARRALGYTKSGGEWMTRDELMAARGMIMYRGRYRTRQEIELWEMDRKSELAEKEWFRRMKMWRDWLNSPDRFAEALKEIKDIRDPYAVPALTRYVEDPEEPRKLKVILIDVLAEIGSGRAIGLLVERSLKDKDQEVRLTCLDEIVERKPPAALAMYIAALKSKDNKQVNRAARALGELGNPEAIQPLFDALVTEHKYVVQTGQPGQLSSTFTPSGGGGGGLSFGGGGPKIFERELQNREVRSALVRLTKEDFGFEEKDWKRWYASTRRANSLDARRD